MKELKSKMNELLQISRSIYKLYELIADLEINGKQDTKEYYEYKDLLPEAIRIEKKKFKELGINKENYKIYQNMVDPYIGDISSNDIEPGFEHIEKVRISNMIDEYLLSQNMFYDESNVTNLFEIMKLMNYKQELAYYKYANFLINHITNNYIAIDRKSVV